MAKEKIKKETAKQALRLTIAEKLQATFTDIKATLGEKKFDKHIKKASKILASGVIKKSKPAND